MTLKEELEILRGEPIEVFDGDPMDIPCVETLDAEKLCKHPVVSVHMCTYNHESYIRQAIEGVMMQKTDFEFELVIGEDASQDTTRDICFEYQKKYPDKIRVLWWHENVSKFGGNGRRVTARCRGEFIAFCEGDDYWIDPLKLQKQVDVMRRFPSVGYCVTGARVKCEVPHDHPRVKSYHILKWYDDCTFQFNMESYRPGLIKQVDFMRNRDVAPRTATVMIRKKNLMELYRRFDIFKWKLRVGDKLFWQGFPFVSDAYYIVDETAVYRLNDSGVTFSKDNRGRNEKLYIDFSVIGYYYAVKRNNIEDMLANKRNLLEKRITIAIDMEEGNVNVLPIISNPIFEDVLKANRKFWYLYQLICRIGIRCRISTFRKWIGRINSPMKSFIHLLKRFGNRSPVFVSSTTLLCIFSLLVCS